MLVPNSRQTLATRRSRESVSPYTLFFSLVYISVFNVLSAISEINEEHQYFYHSLVCMHLEEYIISTYWYSTPGAVDEQKHP